MAPCQVHPIILHTNGSSSRAAALRTPPDAVRPPLTGGVRRNLFGAPDQREMVRQFDNENARQRKRLENYKIIEAIAQTKENSKVADLLPEKESDKKGVDKSLLPDLIAQELEAHEKAQQKKKNNTSSLDGADDDDLAAALALRRQEKIETTPTAMITKTKLRTVHINRAANDAALNEVARYKPYSKQTLITDSMPKRKVIPPS